MCNVQKVLVNIFPKIQLPSRDILSPHLLRTPLFAYTMLQARKRATNERKKTRPSWYSRPSNQLMTVRKKHMLFYNYYCNVIVCSVHKERSCHAISPLALLKRQICPASGPPSHLPFGQRDFSPYFFRAVHYSAVFESFVQSLFNFGLSHISAKARKKCQCPAPVQEYCSCN